MSLRLLVVLLSPRGAIANIKKSRVRVVSLLSAHADGTLSAATNLPRYHTLFGSARGGAA
jgi:hypothetical protein